MSGLLPPPVLERPLPPPMPAAPSPAASSPAPWSEAFVPTPAQRLGMGIARTVPALALWFGLGGMVVSHVALSDRATSAPPGETLLRWTTWGHVTDTARYGWTVTVAYPPVGLLVALALCLSIGWARVDLGRMLLRVRADAGLPKRSLRSAEMSGLAKDIRRRLADETGRGGRFLLRSRRVQITFAALAMVGSLAMTLLGWYARSTNLPDAGFVAGVGPTVAIIAGLVTFGASLLVVPWGPQRRAAVGPNGELAVEAPTST